MNGAKLPSMGRPCKACSLGPADGERLELLIQDGNSLRIASRMFNLSRSAIHRHMRNHRKNLVAEAVKNPPAGEGFSYVAAAEWDKEIRPFGYDLAAYFRAKGAPKGG